jgi:hypothetical protein
MTIYGNYWQVHSIFLSSNKSVSLTTRSHIIRRSVLIFAYSESNSTPIPTKAISEQHTYIGYVCYANHLWPLHVSTPPGIAKSCFTSPAASCRRTRNISISQQKTLLTSSYRYLLPQDSSISGNLRKIRRSPSTNSLCMSTRKIPLRYVHLFLSIFTGGCKFLDPTHRG